MTVLVCVLVGVGCFAFGYFLGSVVDRAVALLRARGEAAEAPDPDPFDQDASRFVGRATVPSLPSVPVGTGESLARELTDYLKGNRWD